MNKIINGIGIAFLLVTAGMGADSPARAVLQPVKERKTAPQFRLKDDSGKTVKMSDHKGKVILLNMWATNCNGCNEELPYFVDFDRMYRSEGLDIVGASIDRYFQTLKNADEAWALVKPFVKQHGMEYQILMGEPQFLKDYNVGDLPATYLIDRKGRVAATYIGAVDRENTEANIQALLKER